MFKRRPFRTLNLIHVDPEALIHNVRLYQSIRPELSVCPVLKGNAYGHGLTLVGKILDPLRLDYFVVDSIYEAFELKKSRINTPVLVLGYTHPENFSRKLPFHFTAYDEATLLLHAKLGHPIHLEIETGMNRMGVAIEDLPQLLTLAQKSGAKIAGLFTHFATADEEDSRMLRKQEARFQEAIRIVKDHGFAPQWIHAANSAGGINSQLPEATMMRLGVSLYGINPLESNRERLNGLKLAAHVTSSIIEVKTLNIGDSVSYGSSFKAEKQMSIAVVPFGYYEGLPRHLSNKGIMEVAGHTCPIVGRVCMNHTMIDVTGLDVKVGDPVTVYSKDLNSPANFEAQSKKAGTIPYELMVRLNESVRRA